MCVLQHGVTQFWASLWLACSLWLAFLWFPWWGRDSCAERLSFSSLCPSERCSPPPSCSSCPRFSIHPPVSTQTHWINLGSQGVPEITVFFFLFPVLRNAFVLLTNQNSTAKIILNMVIFFSTFFLFRWFDFLFCRCRLELCKLKCTFVFYIMSINSSLKY